jgi:formylglycine-generating enzyme required for sulfatase activity
MGSILMNPDSMIRLMTLVCLMLSASGISGCTGDSGNATNSNASSGGNAPDASEVQQTTKPFDSIPLAKDESYEVPATPEGMAAGEIRELTALKIRFAWCPSGQFKMGSAQDAPGSERNETQFDVSLSRGFWLQQTELAQVHYEALMGANPSTFPGADHPVESLSHEDAIEFCRRLSELPPEKNSGNVYRLPTEAEWEYACRAGSTTAFSFGDDEALLGEYGWFAGNAERTTHAVGGRKPNAWGLHDMHGNVAEWCSDFYADYPAGPVTDPRGPESGGQVSIRGGGWFFVAQHARSAHRDAYQPEAKYAGLGFRLVAVPAPQSSP